MFDACRSPPWAVVLFVVVIVGVVIWRRRRRRHHRAVSLGATFGQPEDEAKKE